MAMPSLGQVSLRIDRPAELKPHATLRAEHWRYSVAKRILDVLIASGLLLAALPIVLVHLVRLAIGGMSLVRSPRVGRNYKAFVEYSLAPVQRDRTAPQSLWFRHWPVLWNI